MPKFRCLSSDALFKYFSVRNEVRLFDQVKTFFHLKKCTQCESKYKTIQNTWKEYFTPEPEIAPSLIKVYAKLQRDETLVLKGWKLENFSQSYKLNHWLFNRGWLYYGSVPTALAAVITFLAVSQNSKNPPVVANNKQSLPYAQIRYEDSNKVNVIYVKPELLHRVEFQTTRTR
jgi:hypothetical protein